MQAEVFLGKQEGITAPKGAEGRDWGIRIGEGDAPVGVD